MNGAELARSLRSAGGLRRRSAGAPRTLGTSVDATILRNIQKAGDHLLVEPDPAYADVPVIVVTVEAEPATAPALGADDYLAKRIDPIRLESWLSRVAQRRIDQARPEKPGRVRAHSPR